jgi:hypothetical protein
MPTTPRPSRALPLVEALERRDAPSASPWLTESFDATAVGGLPVGWAHWGSASFAVSAARGLSPANGLATSATSATDTARTWLQAALPADVQVSAAMYLDTAVPGQVFARGSALDTASPSYYAVAITRGMQVRLLRVLGGSATVLTQTVSVDGVRNEWVRATLSAVGTTLRVQVYRVATGQYLTSTGSWQTAPTWALTATDSSLTGPGRAGLARGAGQPGTLPFDDFAIDLPNAADSFDQDVPGRLPAGWAGWTSAGAGTAAFQVTSGRSLSMSQALSSTATLSSAAARAWLTTPQPADVEASASVYLDGLQPAGVLVRGSKLDTTSPSYYAVRLTRGLRAELVRVVNGVTTSLGTVTSASYFSAGWVRATLSAGGGTLRVQVYRPDTGKYLTAAGTWQTTPAWALSVTDTALPGDGLAGVERPARYVGTALFDDFAAYPLIDDQQSPQVQINSPAANATLSGVVHVQAGATDNVAVSRVEFYVDGVLQAVDTAAPYAWDFDTTTATNGRHTIQVVAYDPSGNAGSASVTVTTQNDTGLTRPNIPQHYSWIRLAELAYSGTPMDSTTQQLLQNSVDLVIAGAPSTLGQVHAVAPATPALLYANASSLYQTLLTDWLTYADAHGLSRESAFYHASVATPFSGNSASSQPVNWFWGVYRDDGRWTNYTSASRGTGTGGVPFGGAGQALYVGYPEEFREINLQLLSGAAGGWSGVLEYATAVDANGQPTAWAPLRTLTDGTAGLTRSGRITFDPPADWRPATVGGSARLFYVRFRTLTGGTAPVAASILGRDYVGANGGTSGVIPVFDYAADTNHDGYLNNAEYAVAVAHGDTARFVYESRVFDGSYGQMRLATNPSNAGFRAWVLDYYGRFLQGQPSAAGLFVDNSGAGLPVDPDSVLEPTAAYANDYGALLNALARSIAPRWVLANTAGGGATAAPVVQRVQGYFEEFGLRPLAQNWQQFEDLAATVGARTELRQPPPYAVLDALPTGGSVGDPRTELTTLAEYYLLADPNDTFLDFYGGFEPATTWARHWAAAAAVDVGLPTGSWSLFASGTDPGNAALTYHVYQRSYGNALVLYKPLSYANNTAGSLAQASATTHKLPGTYYVLNADGTVGPAVTSVTLRNGEGVILLKQKPA